MEKIIIRFAEKDDYENVEKIMKQVQNLHINWRPDIYKECETVLPFELFLAEIEKGTIVVAEADGKIAGVLSFMQRRIESVTHVTRKVVFIDSIAVDENFRGRGIGTKLLDFAKDIAQKMNCDGVELQVNAKNSAAMEFYKKFGFTEKSVNLELLSYK
ncbi:MAG: GNAT family N-acetyltransferase [Oscillospiraceae bacterium]|nr:GNAT family N-acetyltransferase [Oscillospiraceae bacterium]